MKDIKIASDAVDLFEALEIEEQKLLYEFQEETDAKLAAILNEIAWELKMIAEHSTAIAEISIDQFLINENEICGLST
jgi:hypothetical protein